jgi:tRNA(Arg) A34 adenosine deaminase TadA
MCLGAVYWARLDKLYFANTKEDAAAIGFDDQFIYKEIERPLEARRCFTQPLLREEAQAAFREWAQNPDKTLY